VSFGTGANGLPVGVQVLAPAPAGVVGIADDPMTDVRRRDGQHRHRSGHDRSVSNDPWARC